jgi:hypothetical protein
MRYCDRLLYTQHILSIYLMKKLNCADLLLKDKLSRNNQI